MKRFIQLSCLATIIAWPGLFPSNGAQAQLSSNATVYATGLNGPRGLKFGPEGLLYVAEAGTGGSTSTAGKCTQVVPPIGPYFGGNTARISTIDSTGKRTTVASGLPSSQDSDNPPDYEGVADVAFMDGMLYAVTAGGGCSHGNASTPNAIVQVDAVTGSWHIVANLSQYIQAHPARYPNAGDFEPDGTFYSLIAHNGRLYTVEPNHGQIFSVSPQGAIRQEIDISQSEGHIVPTAIAAGDGYYFVGNLGLFPITPDSSKILTLTRDSQSPYFSGLDLLASPSTLRITASRAGFTTVVGLDLGPDGMLYALELSAAPGYPGLGNGKVVRLNPFGDIEDIATGLSAPTGMTFGPDGALYVSNFGAAPPGAGQIVRITVP